MPARIVLKHARPAYIVGGAMIMTSAVLGVVLMIEIVSGADVTCGKDVTAVANVNGVVNVVAAIGTLLIWSVDHPHAVPRTWEYTNRMNCIVTGLAFAKWAAIYAFVSSSVLLAIAWHTTCTATYPTLLIATGWFQASTWSIVSFHIAYRSAQHTVFGFGLARQELGGVMFESVPVDPSVSY